MNTHKRLVFPTIPRQFKGRFPKRFVNDCHGWNFSQAELLEAKKNGRMLTMDLDMSGKPSCSLRCGHCFNSVLKLKEKRGELLTDQEIKNILSEAKSLGLKSVKIIGPGEPLEEKSLIPFLEFMVENGIKPLIFTKATALGNPRISLTIHGMGPDELARRLREDFDVTICFGANSFNPELQSSIVRRRWYPEIRNRALELLAHHGFNEYAPGEPTRLAMIFNPIMKNNFDEVFEVYTWSRLRNIVVVSSPTMVSGKCAEPETYSKITPSETELIALYIKINKWAIEKGIYTLADLERDGIASYVGAKPCQQVAVALFLRRDGLAFRCPGDDVSIQGHLRESSLTEIWENSENLRIHSGKINVGCPPKIGKSIPEGFFENVLLGLKQALS
jgi:MoaA/NifB/PqqE/SkfB family radical SAM enzyme